MIEIVVIGLAFTGLCILVFVIVFARDDCHFCGDRLDDKAVHINSKNERCCLSCALTDRKGAARWG